MLEQFFAELFKAVTFMSVPVISQPKGEIYFSRARVSEQFSGSSYRGVGRALANCYC